METNADKSLTIAHNLVYTQYESINNYKQYPLSGNKSVLSATIAEPQRRVVCVTEFCRR